MLALGISWNALSRNGLHCARGHQENSSIQHKRILSVADLYKPSQLLLSNLCGNSQLFWQASFQGLSVPTDVCISDNYNAKNLKSKAITPRCILVLRRALIVGPEEHAKMTPTWQ